MIDRAHRHKERALVERVGHQIKHECLQTVIGIGANQHGQLPQYRHRGVSQHALEVILANRQDRTQQSG